MRLHALRRVVFVAAALLVAAAAAAQEGHPLAGTWYGAWGTKAQDRDLTVVMKWDGRSITGLINPGPDARPITSAAMEITPGKPAPAGQDSTTGKPPVFRVRIEADGIVFEGTIRNPVAGNRRITGTWTRGDERGTFQIRRL
jgi:hypothetical protein